jgi:hypothetical protein
MGRLLDGYDRLQASPLGSTSPLRVNPGIASMNSQRSAMTSALRRGIREAKRKGDFETVAKGIGMSNAYGVQTTGISNYDERMAGGETFANRVSKEADMNAKLANRAAAGVDKIGNMPQQDTTNPNSTAGAGRGTPIKRAGSVVEAGPAVEAGPNAPASSVDDMPGAKFANLATTEPTPKPTMSMNDTARADLRAKNLDGAFGKSAQNKARREEAAVITDDVISGKATLEEATSRAVAIGGNAYSLVAAVKKKDATTAKRLVPLLK